MSAGTELSLARMVGSEKRLVNKGSQVFIDLSENVEHLGGHHTNNLLDRRLE
jgi:hypothetical protein